MGDEVRRHLHRLQKKVLTICGEIQMLQKAMPLPKGWEAKVSAQSGRIEFHDHNTKKATWVHPETPPPGAACINLFDLPDALVRLNELMHCADEWGHLQGEEERLTLLTVQPQREKMFAKGGLHEQLASSFIGSSQLVCATFDGVARLLGSSFQCKPFGVAIVCATRQAIEPVAF